MEITTIITGLLILLIVFLLFIINKVTRKNHEQNLSINLLNSSNIELKLKEDGLNLQIKELKQEVKAYETTVDNRDKTIKELEEQKETILNDKNAEINRLNGLLESKPMEEKVSEEPVETINTPKRRRGRGK